MNGSAGISLKQTHPTRRPRRWWDVSTPVEAGGRAGSGEGIFGNVVCLRQKICAWAALIESSPGRAAKESPSHFLDKLWYDFIHLPGVPRFWVTWNGFDVNPKNIRSI